MRSLAAFVARHQPAVLAVCEVDAGDALALATRFALQWAYRGKQALFWERRFEAFAVRDLFLPFVAARPFDRRGLLRVDGTLAGERCSLFATQIAEARAQRVIELRFARLRVRETSVPAILFVRLPDRRISFGDRGFSDVLGAHGASERIFVRGFGIAEARVEAALPGIGAPVLARLIV